jgi:hypothetical protein
LNEKIENKTCGNNEKDTVPLIMGWLFERLGERER